MGLGGLKKRGVRKLSRSMRDTLAKVLPSHSGLKWR
jgi:hypothetical protein